MVSRMLGELQRAACILRSRITRLELARTSRRFVPPLPPPEDLTHFTPAVAEFWASMPFNQFLPYLGVALHANPDMAIDSAAWTEYTQHDFEQCVFDSDELLDLEAEVIASDSSFGRRLAKLLEDDPPLVIGNWDPRAWLSELRHDPDPLAANVYVVVSRGFPLLPPALLATFPQQIRDNYRSALDERPAVEIELLRLLDKGILGDWSVVRDELNLAPDSDPQMVLALGVVFRKGKTRLIIDGSAGDPSINSLQVPPDTVLPDIFVTMLAMSMYGYGWKADYEDSFCQHVLELSSQRICAIKWTGDSSSDPAFHGTRVLAFRRLGFGFRSGPSQQQSSTIAVVRALSRRLVAAGLNTANPPAMNHVYPEPRAASQGMHFVNALLAFLDDLGGFCSSRAAAWYSFATYLVLCHRLRLKVSFKPGKTISPVQILHYLGFDCDMIQGIVALDVERIAELLVKLQRALTVDSLSVQETLSLIGVLVFCSVVIRVGRVHYRALIDAVTALGPNPSPKARVKFDDAIRDGVSMWITMLGLLNQRPVSTPISRILVPGQVTTDASFAGWGWEGMGSHALGQWPEDWIHRIGRASSTSIDVLRIWICELELWSCLFLARHLCQRCPHCKLTVRCDNAPVCRMITKLSTRSSACLPILRELAWLLATFDVEMDVVWIDTKANEITDVLSRRYAPDHDAAQFAHVEEYLLAQSRDPEWALWPDQPPPRPELQPHIPVALPADYSTAWAAMSDTELRRLLPLYRDAALPPSAGSSPP